MTEKELKNKKPQTEAQIRAKKKYYEKMKNNEEYMERNRERTRLYVQNNRESFNEKCKVYYREVYYPLHRDEKIAAVRRYQESKKEISEVDLFFPNVENIETSTESSSDT